MTDKEDKPKEAKPVAETSKGVAGGMLPTKQATKSQHLLIAFLIIVVGVLFTFTGGGGIFGFLEGNRVKPVLPDNVDAAELSAYERVSRKIATAIGFGRVSRDALISDLQLAALAKDEGLMPQGESLQKAHKRFLEEEIVDMARVTPQQMSFLRYFGGNVPDFMNLPKRKRIDFFLETDPENKLKDTEVDFYVGIQEAIANYRSRYEAIPLVPRTVQTSVSGLQKDALELGWVRLQTPQRLLDAVKDSITDEEISNAYDEKESEFVVPAQRVLDIIYVNQAEVHAAIHITAEEIEKYYKQNKEIEFKKILPVEEEADETADGNEAAAPVEDEAAADETDAPAADEAAAPGDDQPGADDQSDNEEKTDADEEKQTKPEPKVVYETLEEVREKIIAKLRDRKAGSLASELWQNYQLALEQYYEENAIENISMEDLEKVIAQTIMTPEDNASLMRPISVSVRKGEVVTEALDGEAIEIPALDVIAEEEDVDVAGEENKDEEDADEQAAVTTLRLSPHTFTDKVKVGALVPIMAVSDTGLGKEQPVFAYYGALTESGFKPLEDADVQEQLRTWLAHQKAYEKFLQEVKDLQTAVELHENGLQGYFTDKPKEEGAENTMQKDWGTTYQTTTVEMNGSIRLISELRGPAATWDGDPEGELRVLHLASPARELFICSAINVNGSPATDPASVKELFLDGEEPTADAGLAADVPQLLLFQALDFKRAQPDAVEEAAAQGTYRQYITNYSQAQILEELRNNAQAN